MIRNILEADAVRLKLTSAKVEVEAELGNI